MRRRALTGALALVLLIPCPALARDDFEDDPPAEEPPPPPAGADPMPLIAPPPGIYYVTDTYVADLVTTDGPLTTYTTTTVHESTGSWARVLETVGTGAGSSFDGSAFNGRRNLSDGRAIAGTYYENFVLTPNGFVPVSVVFFQDDAELARIGRSTSPPSTPDPTPPPPIPTPKASSTFATSACCPKPEGSAELREPVERPALRTIRPGLSLLPTSGPVTRIEVLRGRAVTLWLRAFVEGREIPVRSWAVASGDTGDPLLTSGGGTTPFRTSWRRLAPPGAAYELVFRLEVDTPETGQRVVNASIAIAVRSPALES